MFEQTLSKFVMVIALFAVFVLLGNIFAASQHAANRRAASMRRRGRGYRRRGVARDVASDDGADDGRPDDDAETGGDRPRPGASPRLGGDRPGDDAETGGAPPASSEGDAAEASPREPSLLRKMAPQLLLSAAALAVAGFALYVMWKVAQSA